MELIGSGLYKLRVECIFTSRPFLTPAATLAEIVEIAMEYVLTGRVIALAVDPRN